MKQRKGPRSQNKRSHDPLAETTIGTLKSRKAKPRSAGPIDGAPARARLDRPGRRQKRASGGNINDIAYIKPRGSMGFLPGYFRGPFDEGIVQQGPASSFNDPIDGIDAARRIPTFSPPLSDRESDDSLRAMTPARGFAHGGQPRKRERRASGGDPDNIRTIDDIKRYQPGIAASFPRSK